MKEKEKILATIDPNKHKDAAITNVLMSNTKEKEEGKKKKKGGPGRPFTWGQKSVGKNLTWYEKFVDGVGIKKLIELEGKIIDWALEGDRDMAALIYKLFRPVTKPAHHMREQIKDFLKLTNPDNYSGNVGAVIEGMANGEIDLDDGDLILKHLYQGTQMFFNKDVNEIKDAIAQIKAQQ